MRHEATTKVGGHMRAARWVHKLGAMAPLSSQGDWLALIERILIAVASGAVIGVDRELQGKSAGLRTHVLVSLGACLLVMIPDLKGGSADAASRVVQGIAAGIGFLGAGEIIRIPSSEASKAKVTGLTSAAAIWVCAGVGAAAGCGLWRLCAIASLLTFLSLSLVGNFERRLESRRKSAAEREGPTEPS